MRPELPSWASLRRRIQAIPSGTHQVRMEFAYDGDGIGKGGTVTLYIDGQPVGDGRVEQTEPFVFSADETCDVGNEFGSPVTTDHGQPKFNGKVHGSSSRPVWTTTAT